MSSTTENNTKKDGVCFGVKGNRKRVAVALERYKDNAEQDIANYQKKIDKIREEAQKNIDAYQIHIDRCTQQLENTKERSAKFLKEDEEQCCCDTRFTGFTKKETRLTSKELHPNCNIQCCFCGSEFYGGGANTTRVCSRHFAHTQCAVDFAKTGELSFRARWY